MPDRDAARSLAARIEEHARFMLGTSGQILNEDLVAALIREAHAPLVKVAESACACDCSAHMNMCNGKEQDCRVSVCRACEALGPWRTR